MIYAAMIEAMFAAGSTPEQIVATVRAVEAQEAAALEAKAEARREKDRIRQQRHRAMSRDVTPVTRDMRDPSSPDGFPPAPPFLNPSIHTPSPPLEGGSVPKVDQKTQEADKADKADKADFEAFWSLYPNKVGKADARRKFGIARRTVALDVMMAGLRAYVAKTDDRPWCNPATWLHQARWEDQPPAPIPFIPRKSLYVNEADETKRFFARKREELMNGQPN